MSTSPAELKAEAVALLALGYSCRSVEAQLKQKFPGAKVPNYATISRWVRPTYSSRGAVYRWQHIYGEAAKIVLDRMDELRTLPLEQMVKSALRIREFADRTRYLARR